MSVATEFAPVVFIPTRARQLERPDATIIALLPPPEAAVASPLRLTHRGLVAVGLLVATLAVALFAIASMSAPRGHASAPAPATVTVHTGDTLWSIATRTAPDRDPLAEIADLQRINHLSSVDLESGQVIRTR
ncbi:MAG: LysM peptidoglycan-binding domain-containing protein [Actinomycetota bacterium]|nr:LysM peptidoglycan-binding domain-containing protein [Actinomycetota bacterium]